MDLQLLEKLSTYVRYCILTATNRADSGHPTSSLSATELMTVLFFGGFFHYDPQNPLHPNNDRLIFSKGHASPLFYALWTAAGQLSEENLLTYRTFGSKLEGHPSVDLPYVEAATGSLGQGLSIGFGMALNAKYLDELPYKTFVLLGDSEMAEGSQWEAIQLASHYKLDNLIGILDVNRLGQCGATMYGHDLHAYKKRLEAFDWDTIVLDDGHSLPKVVHAYEEALRPHNRPVMIIAKTIKGKGVPSVEDVNGYHGKALGEDILKEAVSQWREVDRNARGQISHPEDRRPEKKAVQPIGKISYTVGDKAATRDAYGSGLKRIYPHWPDIVALDGEVSNSTRAEKFRDEFPGRFFEMYIAEQNMIGAALGLSRRGRIPFVSTFAAFMTRAFDQIRMSQYSKPNIKFAGSHAGTSIGKDGPSQMGLEDIAMFRTLLDSVVFYPSDAVATEKLMEIAAEHFGIVYLRLTRSKTPVIYDTNETFSIGGSKTIRSSKEDVFTIVSAGYTLHEALKAYEALRKLNITVRVIDLYSIKPLDKETLGKAAHETGGLLVVEDHYAEGGMGDAVFSAMRGINSRMEHLAVVTKPGSGSTEELLASQSLSHTAIAEAVWNLRN